MNVSVSSLAMLFAALDSLRAGRNVLIVAGSRPYAFSLARILIAVAKRRGVKAANHRDVTDPNAPWIFARGYADSIELLAKDADVHYDASAR